MRLKDMRIPPVSQEFYDRLIAAFPPLDPRSIKPDTTLIQIQRWAAQQEVIEFIRDAVPELRTNKKKQLDDIKDNSADVENMRD